MSKHQVEAVLPHSVDDVAMACQEAVAQLGWRILDQSDSGLTCKEVLPQITSMTWPAKIEVEWRQEGSKTRLTLNGSVMGFGPLQSGHLKGEMGNLQNRIQLCLRKTASQQQRTPPAPTPQSTLAGELENLARLRSQGILSDEEFANAKAKLLGQTPSKAQAPLRPTPPPPPDPPGDISISCPHCGQSLEADASFRGQRVSCPSCNQEFVVPKNR